MHKSFLLALVASSLAFAQAQLPAAPSPVPQAPPPAATQPGAPRVAPETPAEVPPNAPVITLHGLCPDKPAGTDPKSPECQTVITRSEFEHLADTLSPNMPASAKQKLASDYSRMLVIATEARKQGIENTQHYNDLLGFFKMQLLAQEFFRTLQEKAKPSPAEVEKYYNDNPSKFEEISVRRLFIPRNRPDEVTALKKPAATPAPKPPTDAELQAQGDKLRARLQAGESFDKLQKEVYDKAGFKTPPPPTTMPNWRHGAVPPSEEPLFDMKPKEISKVMVEPAGAYIYEVTEKKQVPFSEVKQQIESELTNERLHQDMDQFMANVKPEANQAYFQHMAASEENQRLATPPPGAPRPSPSPGAAAATTKPRTASSATAAKKPASTAAKPK